MFEGILVAMQCFFLGFGPLGMFLFAIVANASIILPIPIDAVLFFVAKVDFFGLGIWSPLLLGILVGIGSALGEFSGYFLGMAGSKGYEKLNKKEFGKLDVIKEKISDRGIPIIILGALTPFPFDVIGVAAGIIRYDWKKFLFGAAVGKIIRYVIIAYAGYFVVSSVAGFFGVEVFSSLAC